MWPHQCIVGVGSTAVAVGSDDPDVIAGLAAWHIDEPFTLVDYGFERYPAAPPDGPRPIPNLRHGSTRLATSTDGAALHDGLLRVLGSFGVESRPGLIRLRLVPLVLGPEALLVPSSMLALLSARWLAGRGLVPLWSESVAVDPEHLVVHVDPLLGEPTSSRTLPLREWWLTDPGYDLQVAAQVMALATPLLEHRGANEDSRRWHHLADLVARLSPRLVAPERAIVQRELDALVRG